VARPLAVDAPPREGCGALTTTEPAGKERRGLPVAGNRRRETKEDDGARGSMTMLEQYFPILMFVLFGIVVGAVLLTVGTLLSPNRPDAEKLSPYECGFEAFEDARMKFDVRYYLVAILFILFDLEIAFLFPWAVVLPDIGFFGFAAMMIFLAVLVVGFVYEWKKGALEWE
jgi:NADH-quinone oxidoreductase subunit A